MLCDRRARRRRRRVMLEYMLCHAGSQEFFFGLTPGAYICCTIVSTRLTMASHHTNGCNTGLLLCCWLSSRCIINIISSVLVSYATSLAQSGVTHVLRSRSDQSRTLMTSRTNMVFIVSKTLLEWHSCSATHLRPQHKHSCHEIYFGSMVCNMVPWSSVKPQFLQGCALSSMCCLDCRWRRLSYGA